MESWSIHYETGEERLDEAHKKIFQLAHQVDARLTAEHEPKSWVFVIREGVKYLYGLVLDHMRDEEAYMAEIHYPRLEEHRRIHEEFFKVHLAPYTRHITHDEIQRSDIAGFIFNIFGFLLEHITTEDLAIAGKGILAQAPEEQMTEEALAYEIDNLLAATMNFDAHTRILDKRYAGADFGNTIFQRSTYRIGEQEAVLIVGLQGDFLAATMEHDWGDEHAQEHLDLILSGMDLFAGGFWQTMSQRFMPGRHIELIERRSVPQDLIRRELIVSKPKTSVLFQTDRGKFSVSSSI